MDELEGPLRWRMVYTSELDGQAGWTYSGSTTMRVVLSVQRHSDRSDHVKGSTGSSEPPKSGIRRWNFGPKKLATLKKSWEKPEKCVFRRILLFWTQWWHWIFTKINVGAVNKVVEFECPALYARLKTHSLFLLILFSKPTLTSKPARVLYTMTKKMTRKQRHG